MHRSCLGTVLVAFLLLFPAIGSATAGSFRGVIVRGPSDQPGWIWVQGVHRTLRKVEVSRAEVVYDKAVPTSERERQPRLSIKAGAEVRVTAEQDEQGEWRATRIEILKTGTHSIQVTQPRPGEFRTS